MSMFDSQFVETVRERTDIVELIAEQVQLKKTGKSYMGKCPFHADDTPSMSVNRERQFFHCFGCGKGGDVFTYVMERYGVDFPEAVKMLAERAGLPIPVFSRTIQEDAALKFRERLYAAHEEACRFFYETFQKLPANHPAKLYLARRKLAAETIAAFRIGYAPDSWDALYNYLVKQGFAAEELAKGGLVLPGKGGKSYYDRFRHRVMFPIADFKGRIIAFGGRVLDNSTPKYLNSPESPIFAKGTNLFAYHLARQAALEAGSIIVVEGYMDVVTAHQHGVKNVVASLGTALTPDQLRLLRRTAGEIILAYDADAAGQRATLRGLDLAVKEGLMVKVASIPSGKDPDEFIREQGARAFQEQVMAAALPLIDFKISLAQKDVNINQVAGKQELIKRVAPHIAALDSVVEQDGYISKVARIIGYEYEGAIRAEIRKSKGPDAISGNKMVNFRKNSHTNKEKTHFSVPRAIVTAQEYLLALVLEDRLLISTIMEHGGLELFVSPAHREVAAALLANPAAEAADLLPFIPGEAGKKVLSSLLTREIPMNDREKIKDDSVRFLRRYRLERKAQELTRDIRRCQDDGLIDEAIQKAVELSSVQQQLKTL